MQINLPWDIKKHTTHPIIPIFIPFAGCPTRCIFCAQEVQSGTKLKEIDQILSETQLLLAKRQEENKPLAELAFFGGTFTSIDSKDFALCCDFVYKQKQAGKILTARCSTRPDALNNSKLAQLKNSGFELIELGIQSFDNTALEKSRRGYNNDTSQNACTLIIEHNLNLGIQLMPGMPGVTPEVFLQDTWQALNYEPKALRFYPCQVIKNTQLASHWQEGMYKPWKLEVTIATLAEAWLMAMKKNVPVIRMGLAPEDGLEHAILAGPRHPALGGLVMAKALFKYVNDALLRKQVQSITLPHSCRGYFGGDKNSLLASWKKIGVFANNTFWHEKNFIEIR